MYHWILLLLFLPTCACCRGCHQVYVAELMAEASVCAKRNIHSRSQKEIERIIARWEDAPYAIVRLDLRSLLQDDAIDDVSIGHLTHRTSTVFAAPQTCLLLA